jgi:hypothetical protein
LHAQATLDRYKKYAGLIAQWVEQPGCVEHWLITFPEWRAYKPWLEEFIQTLDQETHEAPQSP